MMNKKEIIDVLYFQKKVFLVLPYNLLKKNFKKT